MPRVKNSPTAEEPLAGVPDIPPARLLLVDDQESNLIALSALLAPLGHVLDMARSGAEALKRVLTEDYAAILLDAEMPVMNGFETAALIKQRERSRYIPILFLTAGTTTAAMDQAYATGAVDFIFKPVDPVIIRSKVSVFVDLFRQREQIRQQAAMLHDGERRELALRQAVRERMREQRYTVELARREAQLREFKTTLDATLDGVLLFEPERLRFLYANRGAETLVGYTGDELRSMTPPEILASLTPEQFESILRPLRDGSLATQTFESTVRKKDGSLVPVDVFLQYVPDSDDSGRYVFLVRDISERRRSEDEKAALTREMERMALRQRTFLREVLAGLTEGRLLLCDTPADLPKPLLPYGDPIQLDRKRLRLIRRLVVDAAEGVGLPLDRRQDLETAVGEAAMNAVVHGHGGEASVCCDPDAGIVQIWIRDEGKGIAEDALHRATLERGYSSVGTLGHGFWLMLKTCDRLYLLTGTGGTTVVLEQGRMEPLPGWMQELPSEFAAAAAAEDPVVVQ